MVLIHIINKKTSDIRKIWTQWVSMIHDTYIYIYVAAYILYKYKTFTHTIWLYYASFYYAVLTKWAKNRLVISPGRWCRPGCRNPLRTAGASSEPATWRNSATPVPGSVPATWRKGPALPGRSGCAVSLDGMEAPTKLSACR